MRVLTEYTYVEMAQTVACSPGAMKQPLKLPGMESKSEFAVGILTLVLLSTADETAYYNFSGDLTDSIVLQNLQIEKLLAG